MSSLHSEMMLIRPLDVNSRCLAVGVVTPDSSACSAIRSFPMEVY